MRITGLASGLDMDQLVKDSMKPYRIKIDRKGQDKEILEIKQKLYRETIKDSREFYNKYFDVTNKDSLLLSSNYGTTKFESSDESRVTVNGLAGAKAGNYTVEVKELADSPRIILNLSDFEESKDKFYNTFEVTFKGKTTSVDIAGLTDEKAIARKLNDELSSLGIKAEYSSFANGIVIEGTETGSEVEKFGNKFTVNIGNKGAVDPSKAKDSSVGRDAEVTIKGKNGVIEYGSSTPPAKILSKNKVLIDGMEFTFHDKTDGQPIRIIGKTDAKDTKEKIVNFINDYNKMIEKLNTLTTEKRDRSFMPLTEDQKKDMSESEVKLWNERVQKGQLNRDSDLSRITNSMKQAMRTLVEGSGLNLEKIGIKPVGDYQGTKNGTFTVDEKKLTESLEQNSEEVMNLFTKTKPTDVGLSESKRYSQTGLMQRLKETLYNETVTVTAPIIKKAGIEGSSTSFNNEISKSIAKYEQKMKDMDKDFSRREQLLYSKYSKLETMMNKYNSQQSYLMQQLGMN